MTISNKEANRIVRERISLRETIKATELQVKKSQEVVRQARGRVAFEKNNLRILKDMLKELQ